LKEDAATGVDVARVDALKGDIERAGCAPPE